MGVLNSHIELGDEKTPELSKQGGKEKSGTLTLASFVVFLKSCLLQHIQNSNTITRLDYWSKNFSLQLFPTLVV